MPVAIHNLYQLKNIWNHISERIIKKNYNVTSCVRRFVCFKIKQKVSIIFVIAIIFILLQCYLNEELSPSVQLPFAGNVIDPRAQNIFFFVTEGLTATQACAIESAAFTNPWRYINVLFSSPGPLKYTTELQALKSYKNIILAHIEYNKLTEGTPFAEVRPGFFKSTDVIKILTMNKYGGIYLDLNVITVKTFDGLSDDFVVRVGRDLFTIKVVSVTTPKLREALMNSMVSQLLLYANKSFFEEIGDNVLKTSLARYCATSYPPDMTSETCPGLEIYNSQFVFKMADVKMYFQNTLFYNPMNDIRAVSMKNHSLESVSGLIRNYYPTMAAKFCQKMFKHYTYKNIF